MNRIHDEFDEAISSFIEKRYHHHSSSLSPELTTLNQNVSRQEECVKALSPANLLVEVEHLIKAHGELECELEDVAYRQGLSDGVRLIVNLMGA